MAVQETGEATSATGPGRRRVLIAHPPSHPSSEATVADARHPGGRPSKYDPAFCEQMIAHCSEGRSLTSFSASIRMARRTLLNWAQQHEEFAEALEVAKACACAWWEDRGREVGDGDGGPGAAAMVQFMLKNFGTEDFSDRRQVEYSGGISHSVLTYEQALEEARLRGLPERVLIADNTGDLQ